MSIAVPVFWMLAGILVHNTVIVAIMAGYVARRMTKGGDDV